MRDHLEQLFEEALALPAEERPAFAKRACRGDAPLLAELTSLLAQVSAADEFFERLSDAVLPHRTAAAISGEGDAAPTAEPEFREGDTIAQYRIQSLLGSGGMGMVYRAHDTRLERDVALKFLRLRSSSDADAETRLVREARSAASLQHPNVCSIHEIGATESGRVFISMPYYDGETLKARLRRGPLSLTESVSIAAQVARALGAAHARAILHRDVKPANVLLGSDGTVRLLDFGLAATRESLVGPALFTPGTVAYMSPEQVRGDALDARTDLWSLGVVLYEMLAGARPFAGVDLPSLRHAIVVEAPPPLSRKRDDVPAGLEKVVEKLLRKDPGERYASAAEVVTDLEALAPGTPRSLHDHARRPLVAIALGSALLLALVATLVWRSEHGTSQAGVSYGRAAAPALAVLPFANLGAAEDNALAAGLTEELIGTLARLGDLRVIASTSTARFKTDSADARTIARELGVSSLLEGGVQKVGSRLRVRVRFVDGRDGSTRWSQTYDRAFTEVFAVQDEIVRAVAAELDLRLEKDRQLRRHRTRSPAAYELYLRAWDPVLLRSESGIWKAQEGFQQAIAADSQYAAAYAGLALTYVRRARTSSDPGMPIPKLLALADETARKAIALDDSLAEAYYALGRVREAAFDFRGAEVAIRRAIALDPRRSVYRRSLSYLHAWSERPRDELAEAQRAVETDPLNPYAHVAVASALFGNRRYDESLAELDRLAAMQPPLQAVAFAVAQCYYKKGMFAEAIAALRPRAEAGDPIYTGLLGYILGRAQQHDEARRILTDLLKRHEQTGLGTFQVAIVYAGLGDFDQAFAWLDKAVDDRTIGSNIMGPTFDELHADPRFERVRQRLGLPAS